jgi:hypothetical protein
VFESFYEIFFFLISPFNQKIVGYPLILFFKFDPYSFNRYFFNILNPFVKFNFVLNFIFQSKLSSYFFKKIWSSFFWLLFLGHFIFFFSISSFYTWLVGKSGVIFLSMGWSQFYNPSHKFENLTQLTSNFFLRVCFFYTNFLFQSHPSMLFFFKKKLDFVISFQFGYPDLITWTVGLVSLSKLTLVFWSFVF